VSGELGLRRFLEEAGHTLVVTSDKDGPDSEFEQRLPEADVVISQPFWPAYLTAERIAMAPNLKLAITAGIGSDHVDLQAAIDRGLTVAEVTYSNSISVSEHVVMMILALVRNYIPSYQVVVEGGWNIADCAARSYDLEGMQVGTVGAGRIGSAVLRVIIVQTGVWPPLAASTWSICRLDPLALGVLAALLVVPPREYPQPADGGPASDRRRAAAGRGPHR